LTPIPIHEIRFSNLSVTDEVGRVFFWKNNVFRAINASFEAQTRHIFSCGLWSELMLAQLVPFSEITDYQLDGYSMVLFHQKIEGVTYVHEWSFGMLQKAAETILEVNRIARKYGYETKDAHPFNIIFDGIRPVFIDLGSFQALKPHFLGWTAHEQFVQAYLYPLRLEAQSGYFLHRYLNGNAEVIPHETYWSLRQPLLRKWLGLEFFRKNANRYFKLRRLSGIEEAKIKSKLPAFLAPTLVGMIRKGQFPFQTINFEALKKAVYRIRKPEQKTLWGDYHDAFYTLEGKLNSTSRFDRIIEILGRYEIRTVLELAGNQGAFAQLMLERLELKYVICSDYDDKALEGMFQNAQKLDTLRQKGKLIPALLNFIFPSARSFADTPAQRFKTDLAVALAVTHHLLLTQKISIDSIFQRILDFSPSYIAIEFMPMGLFDGNAAPPLPAWYHRDWFRENMEKYTEILHEEQLEENRIFFFGKVRQGDAA
jgi:hypothetical protein